MLGCPKCRTEVPAGAQVCPACGAEVAIWLSRGGQVYGPYSLADLQRARAEGRLGAEDLVTVGRDGPWQPLATLVGALGPAAPPLPPMPRVPSGGAGSSAAVGVVVVAVAVGGLFVLMILAAILFPVFAKAREKARQSACQGNLKQVSLSLLQYAQDYDGYLPPAPGPEALAGTSPAAGRAGSRPPGGWPPGTWQSRLLPYTRSTQVMACPSVPDGDSYALNARLYGRRLSAVRDPARTVLVYDRGFLTGADQPHNEGSNVGFVDGHVRWLRDKSSVTFDP